MKALTASEQKSHDAVQALMDQHTINWGQLLQILQTVITVLGPILSSLGGGTTTPAKP